jgi:hypothetical protein
MKKVFLLAIVLLMSSCKPDEFQVAQLKGEPDNPIPVQQTAEPQQEENEREKDLSDKVTVDSTKEAKKIYHVRREDFVEVEIDGCQYIYDQNFLNAVPAIPVHKGNCKNPIHKQ